MNTPGPVEPVSTVDGWEVDQLPTLPSIVVKLMTIPNDSDELFDAVLDVARSDPPFAVRVIHMANSAMSNPATPIDTLPRAVTRIGARQVADLLTTVALAKVFVPKAPGERALWAHAIEVATGAQLLATRRPHSIVDADVAYLTGLVHDIGRFLVFERGPEFVGAVDDLAWQGTSDVAEAERTAYGLDHAELGARVCEHWGLSPEIVAVVRGHHRDARFGEPELFSLIRQADWLSMWARSHPQLRAQLPTGDSDSDDENLVGFGIDVEEVLTFAPEVVAVSHRAFQALGFDRR